MAPPSTLLPLEAEAATISACFGDTSMAQKLVNLGLTNKHYGHPRVRPIADAVWACWAEQIPISVFAVMEQLQKAGTAGAVPESYVRALYDAGDSAVVLAAERNAKTIRLHAAARLIYGSSETFRDLIASSPDELESLIAAHTRELELFSLVGQDDETEGDIRTINQAPMTSPVGVPTGVAWFDLISLGLVAGDIHGVQGGEKKGKSRWTCALTLGACQHNVQVDAFCTDGTVVELRNRLACLVGTNVLRRWQVPEDQWLLSPRRLFRELLNADQNAALDEGQRVLDQLPLRMFDLGNGIGQFETLFRKIRQGARKARAEGRHYLYIIDHLADITWSQPGKNRYDTWVEMITRLKEFTIGTPNVTGLWVNQRDEQTNKAAGKHAGSGSFMGGKFGQTVVFLWEMHDKNHGKGWMGINLKRSRWGDGGNPDNVYPIEPNSGYIKERKRLPANFWVPFAGMDRPQGPVERLIARAQPIPASDDYEAEAED